MAEWLAPLRWQRNRPCPHLGLRIRPTGGSLPFQIEIEQIFFTRRRDDQPWARCCERLLHGLDQIIELLRRGVSWHRRRVHVVGLEQVSKICFTLLLSEKLFHPALALLAHELDHELDVVL